MGKNAGTRGNSVIPRLDAYLALGVVLVIGTALVALPSGSARAAVAVQDSANGAPGRVPAFHSAPPAKPLPDPLPSSEFSDAFTRNTYAMAAKVRNVFYQEPCYCYCDKEVGHHSLYDCFATTHASFCGVCRYEAVFTYEQTRKGHTPAQIRKEIIAGDWKNIDPMPYASLKDIR
jgi:hypothetical protein